MRNLSTSAVVLEISRADRFVMECGRTSKFPLSLSRATEALPAWGSAKRLFVSACVEGTAGFNVHVWVGEDASRVDTDSAYEIVESLRPVS
jgi:hypothetical protein